MSEAADRDGFISEPSEDIRRADEMLNRNVLQANDIAWAAALCQLAQAKLTARGI